MCWKCDHPEATIEEWIDHVRGIVRRNGWAVQYVEIDRAPFAYTIGLHPRGLPELFVSGLEPQSAAGLLNDVARLAIDGLPLTPGAQMRLETNRLIEFVEVEHPDAHMNFAIAIEGPDIKARQVVWADDRDRLPWNANFQRQCGAQPVLGARGGQDTPLART